jgi:thiol:disulfide interchange protein
MMKKVLLSSLLFVAFALNVYASQVSNELPVYSQIYDASRNPNADGRAALKLASETQRKVLIEVGGDWCSWCHVLDRFIKEHPEVEKGLHDTFVVLKVNISEANDNVDFMRAFPPAQGYPHMYVTDSSGAILHSQDTAEFREDNKYSVNRFRVFFERWKNHDE